MKAKKALKELKKQVGNIPYYEIIDTSLESLKIIKKKEVNLGDLLRCENLNDYNDYCTYGTDTQLTEDEYKIIMEALRNA